MNANATLTVATASLVRLIDAMLNPNPDDPGDPNNPLGPYGPLGPVIRDWGWALPNQQPLPHEPATRFRPARLGPLPDPWRAAWLARIVIDRAEAEYRLAEVMSGTTAPEHAATAIRNRLRRFVDDWWCPTPWPWPWPWPPAPPGPLEWLAAGVQFHHAAEVFAGHPLQTDFANAATQLLESGLKQLEAKAPPSRPR